MEITTGDLLMTSLTTTQGSLMTTQAHTEETLIDTQLRLEEEMTKTGIDRYMKAVAEAKQYGSEDKLAAAQVLLKGRTDQMAQAIEAWLEETSKGRAGNNNLAFKYLQGKDPQVLAFVTLRKLLARVSMPNVLVQTAATEIAEAIQDEETLAAVRASEKKTYDSIIRGAKKRVSDHYKRVYALRRAKDVVTPAVWPKTDAAHVGIKLIDIAIETLGWFSTELQRVGKNDTKRILVANEELVAQMEANHHMTAMLRPTYEPMVVQPRDWTTPYDGGYLSSAVKPVKLVKISSPGYYEELSHTEMPVVYSAVNALQRSAWQINTPILDLLLQVWERGHAIAGLPHREGREVPPKPFDIDTNEESRMEWRKQAALVYQANTEERSKRVAVTAALNVASRYNEFPRIYFPYQLDFRGRIYAVPAFNPQGPDFMKALLRFSNGKPLGAHGAQWLAMHGANVAGYDKCTLEERVQWVLDNEELILACAEDPLGNLAWCEKKKKGFAWGPQNGINGQEVDKPWQFLAFALEWAGYRKHGESFVSKLAVALDGSCSGLQHFSCMLRDSVGGAAVNLVPSDKPQDVYGLVATKVTQAIKSLIASGPSPDGNDYELATQWEAFGINRKVTKRPVMTLSYGSRQYGFREQLMEDLLRPALMDARDDNGDINTDAFPFDKGGYPAATFMARHIWDAVTRTLVKSVEAMDWLQAAASAVSAEGLPIRWSSPVGFPVMQAYWDTEGRTVKTALNGKVLKLTISERTENLDRRAQANGISPNFIHSCDAAHMMLTTVRATQEDIHSFAMIHDSFGTTAAQTEDLFRIVRESLVEMYRDVDVLENFGGEIKRQLSDEQWAELPALPQRGTLDLDGIRHSKFCFA